MAVRFSTIHRRGFLPSVEIPRLKLISWCCGGVVSNAKIVRESGNYAER